MNETDIVLQDPSLLSDPPIQPVFSVCSPMRGPGSSVADEGDLLTLSPAKSSMNGGGNTTDEEMVSGRWFIRQLCLSDRYFAVLAEDYLDTVLADRSPQQSIHNWNIVAVCLADNALAMNDEVLFRIMSGDAEVASALTEDIQTLREVLVRTAEGSSAPVRTRWKVLMPTGQKPVPLKQRLNPFVAGRDSSRPPTIIRVYDADKLNKMRQLVVLQTRELETKLARARERKSQETRAAEAAAQQKLLEEQMSSVNLQKSDMLRLLENLEAKFGADEKRIHQMKKLTASTAGSSSSPLPPLQQASSARVVGADDSTTVAIDGEDTHHPPPPPAQSVSAPASGAPPHLHKKGNHHVESPPRLRDPNSRPFEKKSVARRR